MWVSLIGRYTGKATLVNLDLVKSIESNKEGSNLFFSKEDSLEVVESLNDIETGIQLMSKK